MDLNTLKKHGGKPLKHGIDGMGEVVKLVIPADRVVMMRECIKCGYRIEQKQIEQSKADYCPHCHSEPLHLFKPVYWSTQISNFGPDT